MRTGFRERPATKYALPSPPDFRLNFLQVTLSADHFEGSVLPFETSDQLHALRVTYGDSHLFWRDGDQIFCVPLHENATVLGTPQTFSVQQMPWLVRYLLQEAVLRFLHQRGYSISSFNPPTFIARQPQLDLLAKAVGPKDAARVNWLHVYPQYSLDARTLTPHTGAPTFGLQIRFRTRNEIDCSVADLLARGLDMRGRYVLTERPSEKPPNPQIDPVIRRHLVGCVREVVGATLLLTDAPDVSQVSADQSWLEARDENLIDCLHLANLPGTEDILKRLDQEVFHLVGAPGRLQRVNSIASLLRENGDLLLAADLSCTAGDLLAPSKGTDTGTYRQFPKPTFVFDPAGSKTNTWHNGGLVNFGPFDAESFTKKRPEIAVITPQEYQGDVEVFLRQFKEGMPPVETARVQVFTQGFVRKYHLNDCTFRFETFVPGPRESTSYRQACLHLLSSGNKPDLAFVIIQERHQLLRGDEDPYLATKSALMSHGIPVQEVEIESIRVPPGYQSSIRHTLDNIGLASYAKLGGTPFVLAASPALAHELVIGIGSATLRTERLSGAERFVGITTVFTADGNYLLSNTSREVEYEAYPEALLTTLRSAIEDIRLRNAWQPGDPVRLIFHVCKPLKDVEAQAVKQLVGQLTDFQVEFAFLHVSEEHDWVLFDRNSRGVKDWMVQEPWLQGKIKGQWVPERGFAVPLNRSEILLTVTGPRQLKTPLQGAPSPLLLHLHRESTFRDLEYLAGQVYRFTALSWRSFLPASRPVTILYSDRIAGLLGKLRQVRNWNPDVLATLLRGSRWFL